MTYHDLLSALRPIFGSGEARAIARLVLEESFGLGLADIAGGKVTQLSAERQAQLLGIIKRLQTAEPVQHVLGWGEFLGRRFRVTRDTLIPRPETERLCLMAAEALAAAPAKPAPRLLDIGTGSGCIAVTAALMCPGADIEAWDISQKALDVARGNAEALGARVTLARRDILSQAAALAEGEGEGERKGLPGAERRYAVIVSNPPYICRREAAAMSPWVTEHEPPEALFVPDSDPLLFYRAIARFARHSLLPGGELLLEINRAFARETSALLSAQGLTAITVSHDIYDNPRYISSRQPGRA